MEHANTSANHPTRHDCLGLALIVSSFAQDDIYQNGGKLTNSKSPK